MVKLPEGVYDQLVTTALRQALSELPLLLKATTEQISPRDAIDYLAREVGERTRSVLRTALGDAETSEAMIARANEVLALLESSGLDDLSVLTRVAAKVEVNHKSPLLPLSQSALVTNDQQLNFHRVLRDELLSADTVDMVCPFIGNQGLNLVHDLLRHLGPKLRVITTTYLGGTHLRALERLAEGGAQIKIIYERPNQKTSLHAKAWIFHRHSGFTTATIGSSNLSVKALADGLEWNVRLGAKDTPQVLQGLIGKFERLWSDSQYELFNPARDSERVGKELASQRNPGEQVSGFFVDLAPFPHQTEALDALGYERLEGKHRNLIVAATGTGKTLISAFDYHRLARKWGGQPTLLFVAHREDILRQSRDAFRAVMRDSSVWRTQRWKRQSKRMETCICVCAIHVRQELGRL